MAVAARVFLITGAGSGLGAALAEAYAAPGVHIGLLGRNVKNLNAVASKCETLGASADVLGIDVTNVEGLRQILRTFDDSHPVDLLIANAGVSSGLALGSATEDWEGVQEVAQTNFIGVLATVNMLSERMVERQSGQIAIMGSLAAYRGLPSCPAYSGAKAGVETYGLALRAGLAKHNVKVSVISPGYVQTKMSDKLSGPKPFMMSAERAAKIIRRGLKRNRARISFPFPLNFGARLLSLVPDVVARRLLPLVGFTVDR